MSKNHARPHYLRHYALSCVFPETNQRFDHWQRMGFTLTEPCEVHYLNIDGRQKFKVGIHPRYVFLPNGGSFELTYPDYNAPPVDLHRNFLRDHDQPGYVRFSPYVASHDLERLRRLTSG